MGDPARRIKPPERPATVEDLLAIPEEERRHEIIDGELVEKAAPSFDHGSSILGLGGVLRSEYGRPPGRGGSGGWWLSTDADIELAPDQIYRPDIVGWRRDRVPKRPTGTPIRTRPDWVCEILSPSNTTNDTIKKRRTYHRYEVPHYWILDPMRGELTVYRWTEDGYLIAGEATRGERIRAEPFEAVEIDLDELLGDVEEEGAS
ncbi:Uma2 family endonuclease [Polyangium sp. y55x31]|uniref:Uma2 family endonuclease n=1 Tax=Polyangium sp. y55x31 TaxID=3042688 RepID=UPI002482F6BB|nr:Uma2 family endonuclease [Polyangium sp. y55x31]MDI1474947.1 Uma2 family endonuclease [Polyangium sp. y55x31]